MTITWKDVSSYSQSKPRGTVEPSSWEACTSDLRIVVTRRHGEEGWYFMVYPWRDYPFRVADDLENAKAQALQAVRIMANRALDDLAESKPPRAKRSK